MQGAGGYGLNSPSAQDDLPTLLTARRWRRRRRHWRQHGQARALSWRFPAKAPQTRSAARGCGRAQGGRERPRVSCWLLGLGTEAGASRKHMSHLHSAQSVEGRRPGPGRARVGSSAKQERACGVPAAVPVKHRDGWSVGAGAGGVPLSSPAGLVTAGGGPPCKASPARFGRLLPQPSSSHGSQQCASSPAVQAPTAAASWESVKPVTGAVCRPGPRGRAAQARGGPPRNQRPGDSPGWRRRRRPPPAQNVLARSCRRARRVPLPAQRMLPLQPRA